MMQMQQQQQMTKFLNTSFESMPPVRAQLGLQLEEEDLEKEKDMASSKEKGTIYECL